MEGLWRPATFMPMAWRGMAWLALLSSTVPAYCISISPHPPPSVPRAPRSPTSTGESASPGILLQGGAAPGGMHGSGGLQRANRARPPPAEHRRPPAFQAELRVPRRGAIVLSRWRRTALTRQRLLLAEVGHWRETRQRHLLAEVESGGKRSSDTSWRKWSLAGKC